MEGNSKYRRREGGRAGLCGVGSEKPPRSVRQGSDGEFLKAPGCCASERDRREGGQGEDPTRQPSVSSLEAWRALIQETFLFQPTFSRDLNPHVHTGPGGWSCSEPEFVGRGKIAGELLCILQNPLFLPSGS